MIAPIDRLTDSVLTVLKRGGIRRPSRTTLCELFATMYQASIVREESHFARFHVSYMSPATRILRRSTATDGPALFPLATPLPFEIHTIRKLAHATDPRSSALVVYPDRAGRLRIWGLLDQQNQYEDSLNRETKLPQRRPSIFDARSTSPGHILVLCQHEMVAELNVLDLRTKTTDVFAAGPIRQCFQPTLQDLSLRVKTLANPETHGIWGKGRWTAIVRSYLRDTLCRILLRARSFQHGGAFIVAPLPLDGLNTKYVLRYDRLRDALARCCTAMIQHDDFMMNTDMLEDLAGEPFDRTHHYQELEFDNQLARAENELRSAIWFVSLLSKVDGLVVITPQLEVVAFGAEITYDTAPMRVVRATTAHGATASSTPVDYNHFGTRHRSMMRYCLAKPGNVGFVISQDGDVRAMLGHGDRVVIWEDIRLQREQRLVHPTIRKRGRR